MASKARMWKARRNEARRQANASPQMAMTASADTPPMDPLDGLRSRIEGRRMARVAAVGMELEA